MGQLDPWTLQVEPALERRQLQNMTIIVVIYTFSIEISTGSDINQDLHDGVEISLGTPVGGLKKW